MASDADQRHESAFTRLAPSPTGALHLGNLRTFLINWALAQKQGWRIVLRMEDLDGPRVRRGAAEQAIELMEWAGLGWDEGPTYQSSDLGPYTEAMRTLRGGALAYAHEMSRSEAAAAASAPHAGDERPAVFGRAQRPRVTAGGFDEPETAHRFVTPPGAVEFDDACKGSVRIDVESCAGDFVIWRHVGLPAYQLAVTVDDARQGITHIVRADDLLESAAQQQLLRESLGLPAMRWQAHVPLVVGEDGRRLAKRHGDTRLVSYRRAGLRPERLVGLVAYWSGAAPDRIEMTAREFAEAFVLERLPHAPVVMTEEDHRWLDPTP